MSRLLELRGVFEHIKSAWQRNQKTSIVLLIEVKGSAYRLPGTKMMMAKDGQMHGTISGGCLESDLFEWAVRAMDRELPLIKEYNLSENEIWGLGIGCKGQLEILILPIEPNDSFWNNVDAISQQDEPFTLLLEIPTGKRLLIQASGEMFGSVNEVPSQVIDSAMTSMKKQTRAEIIQHQGIRYVVDVVRPGEKLIIAGAGRDAIPVSNLAIKAGFNVTIVDPREQFNNSQMFPLTTHLIKNPTDVSENKVANSWWIIMNHHQTRDEEALKLALNSTPHYVGVLGPMERTEEMLSKIGKSLSSGPIHSPIGLDLGAETMDEVAISIVSELMAIKNNRNQTSLHGKKKIHG